MNAKTTTATTKPYTKRNLDNNFTHMNCWVDFPLNLSSWLCMEFGKFEICCCCWVVEWANKRSAQFSESITCKYASLMQITKHTKQVWTNERESEQQLFKWWREFFSHQLKQKKERNKWHSLDFIKRVCHSRVNLARNWKRRVIM